MKTLILLGILTEVLTIICSLKLWVDNNKKQKEIEELNKDISKVFNDYASLRRQVQEKNLK